jgi:hypothetical protein
LGGDLPGDPQTQLVEVASGLQSPVNVAFPPDDSGRIFVVEQGSTIRIINADGSVELDPFLDLSASTGWHLGEQGLLGLALHPDYAEYGRYFVDYNDAFTSGAIVISEFLVDAQDSNRAKMNTERPLLVIEKPFPQHNSGTLCFGADGGLDILTGDGDSVTRPYRISRTTRSPVLKGMTTPFLANLQAAEGPAGRVAPELGEGMARYDAILDRQIYMLGWFWQQQRFLRGLPEHAIIEYETLVASGGRAPSVFIPEAVRLDERLQSRNSNPLYDGEDMLRIGERLLKSQGALAVLQQRERRALAGGIDHGHEPLSVKRSE